MAISIEGAQAYFGATTHHQAAVWAGFGLGHRRGAVATARRILTRGLRRALRDDEPPYQEGDYLRDEYAVYEQALWLLINGQVADATGNDPVPILTGKADAADTEGPVALYAPEALRWLGVTSAAVIRG